MNEQQQIEIIQAHMAGKDVQVQPRNDSGIALENDWHGLAKGQHAFDFHNNWYRVRARRIECFVAIREAMVTQLLTMHGPFSGHVEISNHPFTPGDDRKLIKISFTEPV